MEPQGVGGRVSHNKRGGFEKKLENASLTLTQGIGVCVLKRKSKIFRFSAENDFPGVNLCGESIARIPEA
jgi:hypothetical protein